MREQALYSKLERRLQKTSALVIVLKPDLTIVGASEAYLQATLLWRERIKGRPLFDVFPDNPDAPESNGVAQLRASLDSTIRHQLPHHMAIQRYDVRDHVLDHGDWVEKYWSPTNTPVFGEGSKEITHLVHEVTDVTQTILLRRWIEEQSLLIEEQRATLEQMLGDLSERQNFLRAAHTPLGAIDRGILPSDDNVEEIRYLLKAPETRIYFRGGEVAPWRGLYSAFHRAGCPLVPREIFIEGGGVFPRCVRCGSGALYRVLDRFDRRTLER